MHLFLHITISIHMRAKISRLRVILSNHRFSNVGRINFNPWIANMDMFSSVHLRRIRMFQIYVKIKKS